MKRTNRKPYLPVLALVACWAMAFSASAEEEVSGKNGIELLLPRLPHVDAGIIGEPTA